MEVGSAAPGGRDFTLWARAGQAAPACGSGLEDRPERRTAGNQTGGRTGTRARTAARPDTRSAGHTSARLGIIRQRQTRAPLGALGGLHAPNGGGDAGSRCGARHSKRRRPGLDVAGGRQRGASSTASGPQGPELTPSHPTAPGGGQRLPRAPCLRYSGHGERPQPPRPSALPRAGSRRGDTLIHAFGQRPVHC